MMRRFWTVVGLIVFAALCSDAQAQVCNCENDQTEVCSADGYQVKLDNFFIDQLAGTSHWDYKFCNHAGTEICSQPGHPFSHLAITLLDITQCLTTEQTIQISQVGEFDSATLACSLGNSDTTCNIFGIEPSGRIAKCDVVGGTVLDPGECVTVRVSIAGEMPTLGAGGVRVRTKAAPADCFVNCLQGPSCRPCAPPPPPEQCLTRTIGFWGTHPHITNLYLPVTACGETLDTVEAGSCSSVTEALCVAPGKELKGNTAYATLVRQLTAAKLNLNASLALGGACAASISARIAECEALFCGASQSAISGSGCIEDLNAFNNSLDTFPITPAPFDSPGPANSEECQEANGNRLVIGKGACL